MIVFAETLAVLSIAVYCCFKLSPMGKLGAIGAFLVTLSLALYFTHDAKPDTPCLHPNPEANSPGQVMKCLPEPVPPGCLSDGHYPPDVLAADPSPATKACIEWLIPIYLAPPGIKWVGSELQLRKHERTDIYQQSLQILIGEHLTPLN